MWIDTKTLESLYQTTLGRYAHKEIARKVRSIWPSVRKEKVLGVGYTAPYLDPYIEQSPHLVSSHLSAQGPQWWPDRKNNQSCVISEAHLPFRDTTFDKAILIHSLENVESQKHTLREVWRVLVGGGHLLIIVPNKIGFWSRNKKSPFQGKSAFSLTGLTEQLSNACFEVLQTRKALYAPPIARSVNMGGAIEHFSRKWLSPFAGVLIIEAKKEVFAPGLAAGAKWGKPAIQAKTDI